MDHLSLERLIVPGTDCEVAASYAALPERARVDRYGFENEICVVDVETTGYDPSRDRLIEVAAAIMDGPDVVDRFSTLVDPLSAIPVEITKLTGIDDSMVAGSPCAEQAVAQLVEFIGDRDIVAHNAAFDRGFVERVAGRAALPARWLDSLVFSRIGLPRLRSHRLTDLASAFAPEAALRAHRAADDVASLCTVWRVALAGIATLDPGLLQRIASLAPEAQWPERDWLARIAAGRTGAFYDLKDVRRRRTGVDKAEPLLDAAEVDCSCPAPAEVAECFTAGGIAGRMYEGYEQRAEQVEMAVAVTAAFESSTNLAVEAGTGVGKSMAYLVPAATFALDNGIGVGVATKTNALMDQLVYHELPRLKSALDGQLRYVALKGYDHYPCLRKLERYAAELDAKADVDQIATVATLLAWVDQSPWGDLDSINVHWRRDIRSSIQATQAECTRKRCRYFPNLCYLHGVRRRANSAHVVVTNHALLFRDVVAEGGILPPIRHWIIDEAHSAESEARRQLTVGASHSELSFVLGALHGRRGSMTEAIRKQLRGAAETDDLLGLLARIEEQTQRCSTLANSLFDFVKDLGVLAPGGEYDSAELWLDAEARKSGPWATVESTGRSLARRLAELVGHGRDLVTRLEACGPDFADQRGDVAGLIARLDEQLAGLVAVIDGEDDTLVYSAELDRRRNVEAERLTAARLDVGEVLAEQFYDRVHSVVYTSATIAMGDSFDHFARGVGLDRLPESGWRSLRLLSSYDFERQMAVYVPLDLPSPRQDQDAYIQGLESLLEGIHDAMGGSVLTLFTNRRDMERLYAVLEPRLRAKGLDLEMQRRGTSAKRLRDEFIADEHLSLFALKSFWEGFDAKGDTLRCVVVPKLPFGRPSDPLSRERELREPKTAWRRYQLPEAVIEVKQAAGRLIRSSTDAGCLVIADTRVVQMSYGRQFLRSLPVEDIHTAPSAQVIAQIAERFGR